MIKTKHLLAILLPAILLVIFIFFIRVIQYEPLSPKQTTDTQKKDTLTQIPIYPDDPILGNKKAPITIISFEDFSCEGCRTESAILDELLKKYPEKIKIIWKGLVATSFPQSTDLAHEYSYCTNQQEKFSEFSQFAFANNDNLTKEVLDLIIKEMNIDQEKFTACLNSGLAKIYTQRNTQLATILNIQSLPTIFIDNKQINAPQIIEGWEALLGL